MFCRSQTLSMEEQNNPAFDRLMAALAEAVQQHLLAEYVLALVVRAVIQQLPMDKPKEEQTM